MKRFLAQGGLGNQLFILAAAIVSTHLLSERVQVLTLKNREDSILELGMCGNVDIREAIVAEKLYQVASIMSHRCPNQNLTKVLSKWIQISPNTYSELSRNDLRLGKYFVGFFQHHLIAEKAWQFLEPVIESQISKYQEGVNRIVPEDTYSVLHIRRGDYILNRENFGILSYEYYEQLLPKIELPIIISTDDESFVAKLQKKFTGTKVLGPNSLSAWEALTLMCNATFLVTANSTLSWWASFYLNKRNRHSFIPNPWFKQSKIEGPQLFYPNARLVRSIFE